MRPGLRLEILLLLGGLLLAAFVPLFYAVSTYTRFTLQEVREESARALGRALASRVAEARLGRPPDELRHLVDERLGEAQLVALAVSDRDGKLQLSSGDRGTLDQLVLRGPDRGEARVVSTSRGPAIATSVPDPLGEVVAVVLAGSESTRVEPLVGLSGLYMGIVALALLVVSYFALTRMVVAPLDELSRAAERVASGARRFEVPRRGARELVELGASLRTMTERLLSEEQALRTKVDEVERATQSLRQAQDGLVRSERLASVGRLAAGLAHEVGNPIAAILGLQDLLLEGELDRAEQRDFLQRMRGETERINRILKDLLDFARPAAPRGPLAAEPGSVASAIEDTVALLSPQKAVRDLGLSTSVQPDLPAVSLSREHLVQVLLNLLLNAADACSKGGHIRVSAAASGTGVRVTVEDDGPGVAADVRDRLFEPFVTTKEVGKGTGLGLAVCRGLVEAAGGAIMLDGDHQPGARFIVDLPPATRGV